MSRRTAPVRRADAETRLRREIERLERELAERDERLAEQAKRIKDLEHQLALREQNSTTTSKPPSSDGLAGRQRARGRRRTSRRRPGGQRGHPGHCRPLVPVERVHAVVDLRPPACRHCAAPLRTRDAVGDPRRHQVTDLPPIAAHITEYRCHRAACRTCGHVTQAALPDEVAGQFGPQLTAVIAYLTVVCRMPRLVVQRFLDGVLQIPISLGSTQAAWEEASAATAPAYAALETVVAQAPVLNADETGHRTNGEKRWLWTFVAERFVLYRVAASRGVDVLTTVLGATFDGVLGSDRLSTYFTYPVRARQLCWAHLTRNLLSALDLATTPSARRFCREALVLERRLFRVWRRFRGDPAARGTPLSRAELITNALPIERALFRLGLRHLDARTREVRNLAAVFFEHNEHLFTFVHHEGVEPTNNAAERALRTAVQWRKISFGTRSAEGERAVERLLTATRTCQLQEINVLAYLTAAIVAHRRRQPAPSLLSRPHTH